MSTDQTAGSLKHIYRYPVKSMGGHTLASTTLGPKGVPGDRCWAVRDEERGGIKGGKRFASLMGLSAALRQEPSETQRSPAVEITLADGTTVGSDDDDVNTRLSQAVGSPITLWPLLPEDQLEHYRRQPPQPGSDMEAELRAVFARTPDEPLPDLSGFPEEVLAYESPPGTYFDAFPLLIMSEQTLRTLQAVSDESNFDVRRFRPNLVVDIDGEGFPEDQWVGRTLRIGDARIKVEMLCPRCVMTTHGFKDLPKDPKVMRHLVQQNNGNLGVYATVSQAGAISAGDRIELAD